MKRLAKARETRPYQCRACSFVTILAVMIALAASSSVRAADNSGNLEAVQWMENLLITEKNDLLAQTQDQSLIFLETPEGSILIFERAAVLRMVDRAAFLSTSGLLGKDIIKLLPKKYRNLIRGLDKYGLWNADMAAGTAMAAIERVSEEARAAARRRVLAEYDPLIAEVQRLAEDLLRPSPEGAQPSPEGGTEPGSPSSGVAELPELPFSIPSGGRVLYPSKWCDPTGTGQFAGRVTATYIACPSCVDGANACPENWNKPLTDSATGLYMCWRCPGDKGKHGGCCYN